MNKIFCDLIKVSIGRAVYLTHSLKVDEWGNLYDMAKKQSLVGVCFVSVRNLGHSKF